MAQLIKKSNQFHLTGTRHADADLRAMSEARGHRVRYYKLRDKFGDNGLISVVVLAIDRAAGCAAIDTWVMSCRVLGRSMEEFIRDDVLAIASNSGCVTVLGRYVPSGKNKLVAGLYARLGFERVSQQRDGEEAWQMRLDGAATTTTYVKYPQFATAEARHDVAR
jgi:FkbH-like protein